MQTVTITTDTQVVATRIKSKQVKELSARAIELGISRSRLVSEAVNHYLEFLRNQEVKVNVPKYSQ